VITHFALRCATGQSVAPVFGLPEARRGDQGLAQRDPAVARGHGRVLEHFKPGGVEQARHVVGKPGVEEAPAGQAHGTQALRPGRIDRGVQ